MRDELGRGVQNERRKVAAAKVDDSEILHDKCVRPDLLKAGESLDGSVKGILVKDRVEGYVHLPVLRAGEGDKTAKVFKGEVLCECAGREVLKSAINGIRPRLKCGESGFEVTRRRKKLDPVHLQRTIAARPRANAFLLTSRSLAFGPESISDMA